MQNFQRAILLGLWVAAAVGRAPDFATESQQEPLQPANGPTMLLPHTVNIDLPSGFSGDDLAPDTHWAVVGTIPQGTVYEQTDCFKERAITSSSGTVYRKEVPCTYQIRAGEQVDAYLVVKDDTLIGLYLPSKSAYVVAQPEIIRFKPLQ